MQNPTKTNIRKLAEYRDPLSASFYLPTHRAAGLEKDRIRLKNKIQDYEKALAERNATTEKTREKFMNYHKEKEEQNAPEAGAGTLASKIEKALLYNDRLSSRPIDVSVDEAGVALRGTVQSFRRKEEAERTAISVCTEEEQGMPIVQNDLQVEPKAIQPDPELAESARDFLEETPGIAKPAFIIETKAGVAEVRGSVCNVSERELVGDVLMAVPGIRRVQNYLLVEPDLAARNARDGDKIKRWLDSNSFLADAKIQIGVADGRVLLTGRVEQPWQRSLAERAVRQLCPHLVRIDNSIAAQKAA